MSVARIPRGSALRLLLHASRPLNANFHVASSTAASGIRKVHTGLSTSASNAGTGVTLDRVPSTSHLDVAEDAVEVINNTTALTSGLLHSASNALLELPHMLGGTSYATTILLLTLILRSTITLPMIAWQRRRVRRVQELVVPAAKEWMSSAKYALRAEYRKANKSYEQYVAELNARAKKQFKVLAAKYKCRPLPTMLLPPLLHLPIFIGTTLTIRDACTRSFVALQNSVHAVESESVRTIDDTMSALALESLAWCPSLSDVDPYIVLPVAVGVTALLNVEVQARIRQSLAELRENIVDSPETSTSSAQRMESSDRHPEMPAMPSRIMSTRTARPAPSIPSVLRKKTFVTTSKTAQTPVSAISPKSSASFKEAGSNNASVGAVARSRAITNVLRFGSILFIPIAAASPVAVNLYWLTSNLFSLTQNLVLGYRDRTRTQRSK